MPWRAWGVVWRSMKEQFIAREIGEKGSVVNERHFIARERGKSGLAVNERAFHCPGER